MARTAEEEYKGIEPTVPVHYGNVIEFGTQYEIAGRERPNIIQLREETKKFNKIIGQVEKAGLIVIDREYDIAKEWLAQEYIEDGLHRVLEATKEPGIKIRFKELQHRLRIGNWQPAVIDRTLEMNEGKPRSHAIASNKM